MNSRGIEKERNDDSAEQAMKALIKKGFIPQHEFLISKGYTSPLRNLKALIRSKGVTQQAIIMLNDQQKQHDERMLEKKEKIEKFMKRRERFQQESQQEKYEKKLQNVEQMILANKLSTQMGILEKQGFTNRVKVFKVLMKNKGDVNQAFTEIESKSIKNPQKFVLANWENQNKEEKRWDNSRIPENKGPFSVPFQQRNSQKPAQQQQQLQPRQQNAGQLPEGIDQDAYMQMIRSQEEEKQQEKPQQPAREQDYSNQDLEKYIKKNQFLIANGFTNAKRNINMLMQCNGNEQQALLLLTQEQLSKMNLKRNQQRGNKKDNPGNSSDSDD